MEVAHRDFILGDEVAEIVRLAKVKAGLHAAAAGNFAYLPPAFDTLLSVRVNRRTGAVTLTNGTASPVSILGYSIQSAFGSLNSDTWTSIAANYDDNNDGTVDPDDNWTRLTEAGSRTDLSEFEFDGGNGATLSSLQSVNLGATTWIKTHTEDLAFNYVLANGTRVRGDVQYIGNSTPFKFGDLNLNGTAFELADFTGANLLLSNLVSSHPTLSLAEAYRRGDLNGDRLVDQKDFRIFKQGFVGGGGSLDALEAAMSVPEPAAWITLLAAVSVGVAFIRTPARARRLAGALGASLTLLALASTSHAQIAALQSPAPLSGNQNFGGELGMDFIVRDLPITVSSLGIFDSGQNGLQTATINVALWRRNDGGTPNDPVDDSGNTILATSNFSPGDDGTLQGGNRFRSITPIQLTPGAYTIVTSGFSADDPLANSGELPPLAPPQINDLGGVIQFVGSGRFGLLGVGTFPAGPDGGPANRHHAGTFSYAGAFKPLILQVDRSSGEMKLLNEGPDSYNTDFYQLTSAGGSLNPAGWNSLHDQLPNWLETGVANANSLAEANLSGSTLFGPATDRSLGIAYNKTVDARDIQLTYTTTGGVSVAAEVRYINAPAGVPGDYNQNGTVDAADYAVWRNRLGQNFQLPNEVSGVTPGQVTSHDYTEWKKRFGNTSGSGSTSPSAVPEPTTFALIILSVATGACFTRRRPRSRTWLAAAVAGIVLAASSASANVTNERNYRLGDDPLENAAANQTVGTGSGGFTFDSTGPTGAFLDLEVAGNPKYVSVSDRPGAGATLGVAFDGDGDRLHTINSLNAPSTFWDSTDYFPNLDYPLNYELLNARGMQMWVKPDAAGQNNRQDIIFDTAQHGVFISANNNWSQRFQQFGITPTEVVSNASVQFGQWTHVMHISGIADPVDGFSAAGSALLVNGVAVSAIGNVYNGSDHGVLSVGSNQAGDANFFRGTLDDVRIFLWGKNTGQSNNGGAPFGMDYGRLSLAQDNDWIAQRLATLGVTDAADVNLDGEVTQADVTAFLPHWLDVQTVNGVQVGDWISRQNGDLNYDGIVDLLDAVILHQGLVVAGAGGLDFSLLGSNVPEPGCLALMAVAVLTWISVTRRRLSPIGI